MKKLFLIRFSVVAFFCLLCVLPALAANIKIKGAVKDKLSKEPLIGATIRLLGTQAGAVTDMEGNFELNSMGVLEGMYDIEIKYVGYKTEAVSYTHLLLISMPPISFIRRKPADVSSLT